MMKYINAKNGKVNIIEQEIPEIKPNHILVKTDYSCISPGTELTIIKNSKQKSESLGYSAVGTIQEVGDEVSEFKTGQKVAMYGAPYVYHSEYLLVPKTLATIVPKNVDLKDASLGGIGAISIHALRKANLQFGEVIVVVGMGIFGQIIGQVALNAGYQVIALNRSEPRAKLYEEITGRKAFTNEKKMEKEIDRLTNGNGADAVFLCTGGDSNYLTNKSLEWLRDRGKSVIVGDLQPNYNRDVMFKKEIDILISRAGGPGRYDKSFEENAVDYPYGYVRWTETRNMAEFIRLLDEGNISVKDFVSESTTFETISETYKLLQKSGISTLTKTIEY